MASCYGNMSLNVHAYEREGIPIRPVSGHRPQEQECWHICMLQQTSLYKCMQQIMCPYICQNDNASVTSVASHATSDLITGGIHIIHTFIDMKQI